MKIQHIEVLTQKKKVCDITVAKNSNFVANGLVVHNCKDNVQKFMQKMKPNSVLDIAVATSLFRPGPMGIGAHEQYIDNRSNPSQIEYKHPLLKEVLDNTCGLVVFQEQLQLIYHKLAGVPLDETDAVRKAFTKKDTSNKQKQEEDRKKLKEEFLLKCKEANNIQEDVSGAIFDEMEKFVAYSFNKSHAMAYAITSYQCAWFLTYYPDEWIASYLDFATVGKGKSASGEDPKSIALMEARTLGYKIGKPDINLSEDDFSVRGNKVLVPSFSAIKGVGKTALQEIKSYRPYTKPSDLIVNTDGSWRHSKFNKRAFGNLIKTGAFESMGLVGPGRVFANHKQMHTVFIDNYDKLKRVSARKKNNDAVAELNLLIQEVVAKQPEDWTLEEKMEFSKELTGQIDTSLLITEEMAEYFAKAKIESIDSYNNSGEFYWAIIDSCSVSETRNGKEFLQIQFHGEAGVKRGCKVWNFDSSKNSVLMKNQVIVGKYQKDEWGLKTFPNQIKVLKSKAQVQKN